jgi:hypothetical protein
MNKERKKKEKQVLLYQEVMQTVGRRKDEEDLRCKVKLIVDSKGEKTINE